jgi:hypothetical protein
MPDDPNKEKKYHITQVCLRGHSRQIRTERPIDDADFANEACESTCPYCGGYWFHSTDGRNLAFHVDPISSLFEMPAPEEA